MIPIKQKLPNQGTTIFTTISALAKKYDAINLGQGFPNFAVAPDLIELVKKYSTDSKNQYAPMSGVPALRSAIADKIQKIYNKRVNVDSEITITAGATQALFTAIMAFVHARDEVIIIEPAYDSYEPSIRIAGGVVVSYRLNAPNFKIDWSEVSRLITAKTKMIIINTPQNPIGKTLSESDLLSLQNLVKDTDILVLSDEVYEHLIYDGAAHQSVLRYPELWNRSIAVYSFGKTFHATGWKIGYLVAPDYLMKEIRSIHQWNVFSVNSFLQYALAEYLSDEDHYLSLASFYQHKRDLFQSGMNESKFKALSSAGTYFQLYDYSALSDQGDLQFAQDLIQNHGVACIPVSPFYSASTETKLVRFCFAKTEDTLERALNKLVNI